MNLVKSREKHEVTKPIEKLIEKVRSAANESAGDLWSAYLEVGEMDMVRATDAALRLLVNGGDHIKAMKLVEGIFALVEIAPPEIFTACQKYPALSQMFMEEFLAESDEFIFDAGMDDVIEVMLNEGE